MRCPVCLVRHTVRSVSLSPPQDVQAAEGILQRCQRPLQYARQYVTKREAPLARRYLADLARCAGGGREGDGEEGGGALLEWRPRSLFFILQTPPLDFREVMRTPMEVGEGEGGGAGRAFFKAENTPPPPPRWSNGSSIQDAAPPVDPSPGVVLWADLPRQRMFCGGRGCGCPHADRLSTRWASGWVPAAPTDGPFKNALELTE